MPEPDTDLDAWDKLSKGLGEVKGWHFEGEGARASIYVPNGSPETIERLKMLAKVVRRWTAPEHPVARTMDPEDDWKKLSDTDVARIRGVLDRWAEAKYEHVEVPDDFLEILVVDLPEIAEVGMREAAEKWMVGMFAAL